MGQEKTERENGREQRNDRWEVWKEDGPQCHPLWFFAIGTRSQGYQQQLARQGQAS
jgi:hypothetical protein